MFVLSGSAYIDDVMSYNIGRVDSQVTPSDRKHLWFPNLISGVIKDTENKFWDEIAFSPLMCV